MTNETVTPIEEQQEMELAEERLRLVNSNIRVWLDMEQLNPAEASVVQRRAKLESLLNLRKLMDEEGEPGTKNPAGGKRNWPGPVHALAFLNDLLVGWHQQGIITERQRDHLLVLIQSKRGDAPHPETGLPCHCGEVHEVRRVSAAHYE